MRKNIYIILALFFLYSCSENSEKNFIVSGKLLGSEKTKIYLEKFIQNTPHIVDSTELLQDETFRFSTKIPETDFYRLRIGEKHFVGLLLDTGSRIQVTADMKNFENSCTISGSEDSRLLQQASRYLENSFLQIDSLSRILQEAKTKPDINTDSLTAALQQSYNDIVVSRNDFIRQFISEHTKSLVSLVLIQYLNPDSDFSYFSTLDKTLSVLYPGLEYVKKFHEKVSALGRLSAGTIAPDILLNSPEGKLIKLSSVRGKLLLIDFWASWCVPCRKENPNLVRIYKKFHPKGLKIYGVSLDKEKEAWVNAIKQDGITWTQVSDLQYWNSPVLKLYNVEGIPFSFLTDSNRVIIAKGLQGEELEKKIEELLK